MNPEDRDLSILFFSSWMSEWGEDEDYTDNPPITKLSR